MKSLLLLQFLLIATLSASLPPPNIVFILVDDMGWTGTSLAMDETVPESKSDFYETPNIERLARQGMRFSRAYAPAPMCTPSRAAILTGKTPAELHMTAPGGGRPQDHQALVAPRHLKELPTSEITIAESLQSRGYATAHFGKWHLGEASPALHGFDVHDGPTGNDSSQTAALTNPKDIFGITRRAIDFMAEQSKTRTPFYLHLSHFAVHIPIESLEATKREFETRPSGRRHSDSNYAAMTYDLDASIGTLLDAIESLELGANTYVIFMSDNGAGNSPRNPQNIPLNSGKGTLYEGGIRVPLIIRGPEVVADSSSAESVTGCDLFPTICQLAGIQTPEFIEGTSIVPLLAGLPATFRRQQPELLFHYPHYGQGPRQKPQSALIFGDYKLLKDLETGKSQLFDLKNDLSELSDRSQQLPEKTAELEARLQARLESINAQLPTPNPNFSPEAQSQRRTQPTKVRRTAS